MCTYIYIYSSKFTHTHTHTRTHTPLFIDSISLFVFVLIFLSSRLVYLRICNFCRLLLFDVGVVIIFFLIIFFLSSFCFRGTALSRIEARSRPDDDYLFDILRPRRIHHGCGGEAAALALGGTRVQHREGGVARKEKTTHVQDY